MIMPTDRLLGGRATPGAVEELIELSKQGSRPIKIQQAMADAREQVIEELRGFGYSEDVQHNETLIRPMVESRMVKLFGPNWDAKATDGPKVTTAEPEMVPEIPKVTELPDTSESVDVLIGEAQKEWKERRERTRDELISHIKAVNATPFRRFVTILHRSSFAGKLGLDGCGLVTHLLGYQLGTGKPVYESYPRIQTQYGIGRGRVRDILKLAVEYGIVDRWRIETLSEESKSYLRSKGITKALGWVYQVRDPRKWYWNKVGGIDERVLGYLFERA